MGHVKKGAGLELQAHRPFSQEKQPASNESIYPLQSNNSWGLIRPSSTQKCTHKNISNKNKAHRAKYNKRHKSIKNKTNKYMNKRDQNSNAFRSNSVLSHLGNATKGRACYFSQRRAGTAKQKQLPAPSPQKNKLSIYPELSNIFFQREREC